MDSNTDNILFVCFFWENFLSSTSIVPGSKFKLLPVLFNNPSGTVFFSGAGCRLSSHVASFTERVLLGAGRMPPHARNRNAHCIG